METFSFKIYDADGNEKDLAKDNFYGITAIDDNLETVAVTVDSNENEVHFGINKKGVN
jgi:hypothetical protein